MGTGQEQQNRLKKKKKKSQLRYRSRYNFANTQKILPKIKKKRYLHENTLFGSVRHD